MFQKIKSIIIFVVIGLVVVGGYFFFIKGEEDVSNLASSPSSEGGAVTPPDSSSPTAPSGTASTPSPAEFLALLLSVKSIQLEDAIFTDEAFKTLKDSTIELKQDIPEGRPNPFAPLGTENTATPASTPTPPALMFP